MMSLFNAIDPCIVIKADSINCCMLKIHTTIIIMVTYQTRVVAHGTKLPMTY